MKKDYTKAFDRYFEVFEPMGGSVLQPNRSLSKVSSNGTVFFRNTNGPLAVVTSTGKVFDRIGGPRLDVEEDTRSAAS